MQRQFFVIPGLTLALVLCLGSCSPATPTPANTDKKTITNPASEPAAKPPQSVLKPYTLVMLGDSLTAGLGLAPENAFPFVLEIDLQNKDKLNVRIINAGVSGDTSAAGLDRFDWSVGPKADGVFIALGANDMLNGLAPDETRRNLAAMIERAQKRGLDVYLAGMRASPNLGMPYGQKFDRLYPDLATQYCLPLFAFLMQPLADKEGKAINQDLIQGDGLHPTSEGAARIGHALAKWLAPQLVNPHIPCAAPVK